MIGVWFDEEQRTNTIKTHVPRDWITSSSLSNYFTLNSEHNWEKVCIQLRYATNQEPELKWGKSGFQPKFG